MDEINKMVLADFRIYDKELLKLMIILKRIGYSIPTLFIISARKSIKKLAYNTERQITKLNEELSSILKDNKVKITKKKNTRDNKIKETLDYYCKHFKIKEYQIPEFKRQVIETEDPKLIEKVKELENRGLPSESFFMMCAKENFLNFLLFEQDIFIEKIQKVSSAANKNLKVIKKNLIISNSPKRAYSASIALPSVSNTEPSLEEMLNAIIAEHKSGRNQK